MKAWYRTRVVVFSETDAFSIYVIKRESQVITATNQSDNIYKRSSRRKMWYRSQSDGVRRKTTPRMTGSQNQHLTLSYTHRHTAFIQQLYHEIDADSFVVAVLYNTCGDLVETSQ